MTPVQEFPGRPSHATPGWVKSGAVYHIRIRTEPSYSTPLTDPKLAAALLESALLYQNSTRWYCRLFLLMPDHLHALLAFPPDKRMSDIIGTWKGYQTKRHGIQWQNNYFDHRIRSKAELRDKALYIRLNPVVKGLCASESDWLWMASGME